MPELKKFSPTAKMFIGVGAVIAILAAALSILATFRPPTTGSARPVYIGIGQAVARTAATTLQTPGSLVLIVTAKHQSDRFPEFEIWQAFGGELKKHPALRLLATEIITAESPGESSLTRSQLDQIVQKYPDVNLFVSLCGIPPWDPSTPFMPPSGGSKLVVVENEPATQLAGYFANGSLAAAILPRLVPETNPVPPTTAAAWFDRQYQILTPENYSAYPAGGSSQ